MGKLQDIRRKRLEKLGKNLQDRLSTSFIDIQRLIPNVGIATILSNVPCNATMRSSDQPDVTAISTIPVIVSWRIHVPTYIDIRNGDTITLKLLGENGEWKSAFRAVTGDPYVVQSRKRVDVMMKALGRDDIIDDVIPPPERPEPEPEEKDMSEITVRFLDVDENDISDMIVIKTEIEKEFSIEALVIHGYTFSHVFVNGDMYNKSQLSFIPIYDEYSIYFIYDEITVPIGVKQFAVGRFQRDDGSFGNYAHWYQTIPINWIDDFEIISPVIQLTHVETRQVLRIQIGSRLLLMPQKIFSQVKKISNVDGGFLISLIEVEPTETERTAYITSAYDL